MKTLRVALGLLAAATVACSTLETTADYDRNVDFSQYKTFAFQEGTPAQTSFVQQRIESAISAALQSKGLRPAPADSADLLVYTHAKTSTEKQLNATTMGYSGWWGSGWYGGGWGGGGMATTTVQEYDIKKGTVVIDLVDPKKKAIVWRGSGTNVIGEDSASPEKLNAAAMKVFEGFPPVKK